MKRRNNDCPQCGASAPPPLRNLFLSPVPAFTHWDCPSCHSRLRLQWLPYVLLNMLAFIPALIALSVLQWALSLDGVGAFTLLAAFVLFWAWTIRTFAPVAMD